MTGPDTRFAAMADAFLSEDELMADARSAASVLGCTPVSPAVGATLRLLAAAVRARAVVEIGTGTGVSGLWLLRGMTPDGTLTSIDVDPEHLRIARAAFLAAGHGPSRLRLINGMGLEVLPRLTDGGYDLVHVDAAPAEHPNYLEEAVRLLRPGGIVALHGATDASGALTEAALSLRADERLVPALLPVGEGLLTAVRTVEAAGPAT